MNIDLFKQALAKVQNPNVLVNLVSKRVRQLNSPGASSRPMIEDATNMSAPDIALREIVEDKMGFEMPLIPELLVASAGRKRRKV
jgi:DNA-directed RNA polymerase subunit omega